MSFQNARRTAAACLIIVGLGATARAQGPATTFDGLPGFVKVGDTVTVVDSSGREIKGAITALSRSSIALSRRDGSTTLADTEVTRIARWKRGNLAKGAAWGLGIGTAAGLGVWGGTRVHGTLCECSSGIGAGSVGMFAAIGAGMGIAVAARSREQLVFSKSGAVSRLTVAPLLTRSRRGVLLTYGF
ncbi:MAG: hypothetical protein ABI818_19665 [Acidobacteriota bacterium]